MKRKFLYIMMGLLTVVSTVMSASPALAQGPNGNGGGNANGSINGNPNGQTKVNDRIKLFLNQKKAAANLQAAGGVTASAALIDPATGYMLTDYFGVANWANSPALTKFVDALPGLGPSAANLLGQYIPVAVADTTTYASTNSDYYEIAVVEYTEQMHSELPLTTLRGYVQIVPQGWTGTDLLGNAYSAVPLTTDNGLTDNITINGVQAYGASKPHYLGPAIVAMGALPGQAGKPVRIKFYNLLPTGAAGDLFIPVDTTVMGAGMGPTMDAGGNPISYTQNRATVHLHGNNTVWISDGTPHQWITPADETTPYPKGVSVVDVPDMPPAGDGAMTIFYSNAMSARLMFYHDHAFGITRLNVYVGEAAGYVITDVVDQDLINGTNNSGVNPDHLQVLPGIGTPLVIQDKTFVDANPASATYVGLTDPTWLDPLQTTFGTGTEIITAPDGTQTKTPVAGDLWYPHVYMPAQNPWDITGTNPWGRWMYGPWFYPPTANIEFPPVPNEYYDPVNAPWEPPMRPGTPNPSMPGEAFMDTMLVNGTVYPYVDVEPKAYRFRILNAANDRFLNLSLYQSTNATSGIVGSLTLGDGGSGYTADPAVTITPAAGDTTGHGAEAFATIDPISGNVTAVTLVVVGSGYTVDPIVTIAPPTTAGGVQATATATIYTLPTEVGMLPATLADSMLPYIVSGVPDPAMKGPDWWQIGTEGGFLPAPAVVPAHPISWNLNATVFNFGVVDKHSLLLAPAERADVVVDFSAFAGQTLILYNDAPAAFPASVPTYDYYTNDQDLTDIGGAPITPPGVGPNTRTVMQIRVGTNVGTPTTDVTLANLNTVWAKGTVANGNLGKRGVFEVSQDPIIVPQAAYNSAYGYSGNATSTLPTTAAEQYVQVNVYSKTITPIDASGALQTPVTLPIQLKGAHDEMGGVYDTGYGRMSGMLGLELPASTSTVSQFLPYGYASPPVDIIEATDITATPVVTLGDGTQIWNIIHNGVDTHPIHVHLFNAQLINRVSWDGLVMIPPDPSELGWKETFRMNPLEQIIIALRPALPTVAQIPFIDQVPNSVRLIDPIKPEGAPLDEPAPAGWFDPNGASITSILNHYVNFGWEYVYHCHILAHEEMDMMHGTAFVVPPKAPTTLTAAITGNGNNQRVVLNWADNSPNETSFTVQKSNDGGTTWISLATVSYGSTTYTDTTFVRNSTPRYRVFATNTVGDAATPGFPTVSATSGYSNVAQISAPPPAAPTNLTATLQSGPQVVLTWIDNATNETGFVIERSTNGGAFTQIATPGPRTNTGSVTYTDATVLLGNTYAYRVKDMVGLVSSGYSNVAIVSVTVPAAPSNLVGTASLQGNNARVTLNWTDNANNETGFTIQRATNNTFTGPSLVSSTVGANTTVFQTGNVARGTTFYFRVSASNALGASAWSNVISVTTP